MASMMMPMTAMMMRGIVQWSYGTVVCCELWGSWLPLHCGLAATKSIITKLDRGKQSGLTCVNPHRFANFYARSNLTTVGSTIGGQVKAFAIWNKRARRNNVFRTEHRLEAGSHCLARYSLFCRPTLLSLIWFSTVILWRSWWWIQGVFTIPCLTNVNRRVPV